MHNCGWCFDGLQQVRAAETSKVPIAPMGFSHILRVRLQGGGVYVESGTVTFDSCTITGNTAYTVRAHAQKFPSPRWEFLLTCPNRLSSFNSDPYLVLSGICTCQPRLQTSHRPDGKMPCPNGIFTCFALVLAGRRCLCPEWHGKLLVVHHHWQLSYLCACSAQNFPSPRWEEC